MSSTPKTFDYPAFIEELRVLRDSFAMPPSNHRNNESPSFKQWRHELCDLINRIQAAGYDINCKIGSREFRVMSYGSVSARDQLAAFDRAHGETLIELNTIIRNFEKYGDPKGTATSNPARANAAASAATPAQTLREPPKWDKEATLHWYWKNTPASTMLVFLGLLVSVFLAGYTIGHWHAELPRSTTTEAKWPTDAVSESKPFHPASQLPSLGQPVSGNGAGRPNLGQPVSGTGAGVQQLPKSASATSK